MFLRIVYIDSRGTAEGTIVAPHLLPRLVFSGHALSQTGGHTDMRSAGAGEESAVNPLRGRHCSKHTRRATTGRLL